MLTILDDDDTKAIGLPHARLVFRRRGERWTHAIEADSARPFVAESIESCPDLDDFRRVASPTYQEFFLQPDGDAWVALLVGQFGPRHFSATFRVSVHRASLNEDEPRSTLKVEVDVADRCREPVESLCCSYAVQCPPGAFSERFSIDSNALWDDRADGDAFVNLNFFHAEFPDAKIVVKDGGRRATVGRPGAAKSGTNRLAYGWLI